MDQVRSGGGGGLPPPRSHHHLQMGQTQPRLQVKVVGAVGIAPRQEPQALLGSALALPNAGKAPTTQRWGSPLLEASGFEGAGGRGGQWDLPCWVPSAPTTARP